MKQQLIGNTHKRIYGAIVQIFIQPVVFISHFEIWFYHWSVIEYN